MTTSLNVKRLFCSSFCIVALLLSSPVLADETAPDKKQSAEVSSNTGRPQRALWESSVETTWLTGSRIHGTGGDLEMLELKAGLTRRFRLNPVIELSAGVSYFLREMDSPGTARLPGALQTLSLNLGGEYRFSDSLTLGMRVSPGVNSGDESLKTDDIRIPAALYASYQMSPKFSLLGGVAYTGQKHSIPVLPMIGLRYMPSEHWSFSIGFPRTAVIYKADRKTDFFISGEFTGGEYRLHAPSMGAGIISYKDFRVLAGAETLLFPFVRLGLSGGYAFDRKFVFYDGNRGNVNLDGAPFVRLVIKFFW